MGEPEGIGQGLSCSPVIGGRGACPVCCRAGVGYIAGRKKRSAMMDPKEKPAEAQTETDDGKMDTGMVEDPDGELDPDEPSEPDQPVGEPSR